jgi:hypothetical protein
MFKRQLDAARKARQRPPTSRPGPAPAPVSPALREELASIRPDPPEPPRASPQAVAAHVAATESKPKPQPSRSKDPRADAWSAYVGYCAEIGTPAERRFAADYARSQAQREQYFRERKDGGPPQSLPLPHPR